MSPAATRVRRVDRLSRGWLARKLGVRISATGRPSRFSSAGTAARMRPWLSMMANWRPASSAPSGSAAIRSSGSGERGIIPSASPPSMRASRGAVAWR